MCVRSSAAIADAYRIGWISAVAVATKFSDLAATDRVRDRGLAQDPAKGQVQGSDPPAAGPAQDNGLRLGNPVQSGRQAESALRSGLQADEAATLWEILDRAGSLIGRPGAAARVSEAVASAAAAVGVRPSAAAVGRGGGRRGGGGHRSDITLKHDIVLLGHLDNGLGYYRFSYNGSDRPMSA